MEKVLHTEEDIHDTDLIRLCRLSTNEPGHGDPLVCDSRVATSVGVKKARSLIDASASSPFISPGFVRAHHLTTFYLSKPRAPRLANGSRSWIRQMAKVTHTIELHTNTTLFFDTDLTQYDPVLGTSRLDEYYVAIRGGDRTFTFAHPECRNNCLEHGPPATLYIDWIGHARTRDQREGEQDYEICNVSATALLKLAKKHGCVLFARWPEDLRVAVSTLPASQ